jgi:hypothetical protein
MFSTTLARTAVPVTCHLVHTEANMVAKGITLPTHQDAIWSNIKGQHDGNNPHIGDHIGQKLNPETGNMETVRGKVGTGPDAGVTPKEAQDLCAQAALRLLSTVNHYIDGKLDNVGQVIKLVGYINGTPDFIGHGLRSLRGLVICFLRFLETVASKFYRKERLTLGMN